MIVATPWPWPPHSPCRCWPPTPPPKAKISPAQAKAAAVKRIPGKAQSAKYEFEDGHWQYAVLVQNKKGLYEVEVDATSGKVTDTEKTTPAEEAKEAAADAKAAQGGAGEKGEKGEKDSRSPARPGATRAGPFVFCLVTPAPYARTGKTGGTPCGFWSLRTRRRWRRSCGRR